MTNNGNDKDMTAAIPAVRECSNDPAMTNDSAAEMSHAPTASCPSASARSQLPLHETDGPFQKTASNQLPLHNNKDRSVEHPTLTAHSSIDERQQNKPHQHSVAGQGMNNPTMAYSITQGRQIDGSHAQLDIDHPTREQLLEELNRTKIDLREKERYLNKLQTQYRTNLSTKDQQIQSLHEQVQTILTRKDQELKDLADGSRADIIQKNRDLDAVRQMWKQTARELGKYQTQEKVVDQVTDPEMIQKARQLQYNVRNLAYQHFGGELNTGKSVQDSWQCLQKQLRTPTDYFEACMSSPVKRPMLVGAFLWEFLVNEIFENFWWCGKGVNHDMKNLTDVLKPRRSDMLADWSEAKRRYQMWKANTSALLVDALELDREKGQRMSRSLRDTTEDLCEQLAPLTRSKYEGFETQVFDIINEALDLDQLFSKQVADIYWDMGNAEPGSFSEAFMELQQGEKRTVDGQQVQLVVAPGLNKRGKSTGESYEIESMLLKITVSCELITANKPPLPPRGSSKPGAKWKFF